MEALTRHIGPTVVLSFPEAVSLDARIAPLLKEQVGELIAEGCRELVIDLALVDFVDSTGLGVLVAILKGLRTRGGALRLIGAAEPVATVLEVTRLDRVLEAHDTLDEALDALAAERDPSPDPYKVAWAE